MNIKSIGYQEGLTVLKIAGLIIIFAGLVYARTIIAPVLLALFISIICAQPITWLTKMGIPRWLAIIIVLLTMIMSLYGLIYLIKGSLSTFASNFSKYEASLSMIGKSLIRFLNEKGFSIPQDALSGIFQSGKIPEFTAQILNGLLRMVGVSFLIFLIVIFMLIEFASLSNKVNVIMSVTNEPTSSVITILNNIRHYLGIKTLVCLIIGVFIYLAMLIIGVDQPLIWALIAAFMNYIPNIGSIIAAIPAVLFALVQLGSGGALWTLGAFMVIHNVIGNFFEPRIMGKGLGLSTLVVFLSLIFWGFILGPVGMFLSSPITMTFKILLQHNEKTHWLALLLGTPSEVKIYLKQKGLNKTPSRRGTSPQATSKQ